MSIDTKEKRRQVIDFAGIRGTGMPIPSGLITSATRPHILNLYYEVPPVVVTIYWRNKNNVSTGWAGTQKPSSSWASKTSPSTQWVDRTPPPDGTTQTI